MAPTIVVCGAGIMGASTAYQLAKRGARVILVENQCVAFGASGKAGGFLARTWCDELPTKELARKSFDLHRAWAEDAEQGLHECDYRPMTALSITMQHGASASWSARAKDKKGTQTALPEWIAASASGSELGSEANTAQVNPFKLTTALVRAAERHGAELRRGTVQGLVLNDREGEPTTVIGVRVDGASIECDMCVLALGPWSFQVASWAPAIPPVQGIKAHSIVMHPPFPTSAHALFVRIADEIDHDNDPEIYPRSDGEVYMCGFAEGAARPPLSGPVDPTPGSCEKLVEIAQRVVPQLGEQGVKVEKMQACFLPDSPDGRPLVGAVPNMRGAFIATGHGCWGILMAPATGLALAELMLEGAAKYVDLSPFDPARFQKKSHRK